MIAPQAFYPTEYTLVIFDLSDPRAWDAALAVRQAWGRRYSHVEALDADRIAVVLRSGGALELAR